MKLTRYNPNGPSLRLVQRVEAELGDVEAELTQLANGHEPSQPAVDRERVDSLVKTIAYDLEDSFVTAKWRKGYFPRVFTLTDISQRRFLIDRVRSKELVKTDQRYFLLNIMPYINGRKADRTDLGKKVMKLYEFKYNLMENHCLGQDAFDDVAYAMEDKVVLRRVDHALEKVDELIELYVNAAPAEKESVEEKIYLDRDKLEKFTKWAKKKMLVGKKNNKLEVSIA